MKIRGSAAKVVVSAVVVLVGGFLLVAGFRSSQNLFQRSDASGEKTVNARASAAPHANDAKILEAYGKLPLSFIENQGQTAQEVRYVSHGAKYDLFLTPQEAVVALQRSKHLDLSPRHRAKTLKALHEARKAATTTTALRMRFEGANPNPDVSGAENLPGTVNYYIGSDPQKWRTGVPTYARVKYTQLYPGVDLVFYGNQRKLEYDFIVAPGSDPSAIRMNLSGARKLRLATNGDVLVSVADGELQLQKPLIYQNVNGQRRKIGGKYSLRGEHVTFAVAQYDRREPLIVDPVLDYSTYLGGTGADNSNYAIAVDASGDAYVAGATTSTDFPLKSPLAGTAANAGGTGFVTEFNPTGTAQVFSTYLGGTAGGDVAFGLAVDTSLNIYVTGETFSTDFPVTAANALKPTLSTNTNGTSFLSKISSAGVLTYSTYLGGNAGDFGNGVAADANGNAYVTGVTYSAEGSTDVLFPQVNGYQTALPTGSVGSAFLSRIDTTKSGTASLIYSTYLGGDSANAATAGLGFGDEGFGVVVDAANKVFICGTTTSSNFPTSATTFQATAKVLNVWSSAFISEIDTSKTAAASLVYSTYLGGSGDASAVAGDFGTGIDLQSGTTVAYVTGTTNSADFPTTTGAFQTTGDANLGAAFVTLLDTSVGSSLKYSTFLGTNSSSGFGIKADSSGNAYVAGSTSATAFPLSAGAYQTALATGAPGDGFISEINPAGGGAADLLYSTYFGGSGGAGLPDQIFGIALGATAPTVYVTGETFSTNFPFTAGAFQTSLNGTNNSFVAQLTLEPTLAISPATLTFNATKQGVATASQSITLTNNTTAAIAFTSATITSPIPAAAATDFVVTNTSCGTSIPAAGSCTLGVVFTASAVAESATVTITDGDSSSPQTVALTGTAPALFNVSPATLTFNSTAVGTATAAQPVTVTNGTAAAVPFTSAAVTLTSATGAAADFALNPATCGASIAAAGICTINVTYTPSVSAMETATLTLTDGAGVQTVALTGTVTAVAPSFGLTTSQSGVLTIKKGLSGMFNVNVNSTGGFNSPVSLTCSGAPRKSTCMIAPSSVTPPANGTVSAAVTIATTSLVAPPPSSAPRFPPVSIRMVTPLFAAVLMLLLFLSERRFRTRLGLVGALLVFVALAGCASSGTPKGNSTITITGTSGNLTQTVTVQITVD